MRNAILILVLLWSAGAVADTECPIAGDIKCWRRAAIEKIMACDNNIAGPLKTQIKRFRKVKITIGRTDAGSQATTYYGNQAWNNTFGRTIPPFLEATTLAVVVHEMSHVGGYGEIDAHRVQNTCVDTWLFAVACGGSLSTDSNLSFTDAVYGPCDPAGIKGIGDKLREKLASGELAGRNYFAFVFDASVIQTNLSQVQEIMGPLTLPQSLTSLPSQP